MTHPFYRLKAPVVWATTLDTLSFSSLHALERCPRQWQLRRSTWEGFAKFPGLPAAAALEGTIVHETLDRIFRALALAGLPAPRTHTFAAVMKATDPQGSIRRAIAEADAALAEHPRRASLRIPHDALTLYNRVVQLFQRSYARVDRGSATRVDVGNDPLAREGDTLTLLGARGALTEWPVKHPTLPLRGVVDLVQRTVEGTRVVDFKTGAMRPEHESQLLAYALMWWRSTGDLPVGVAVQRPEGTTDFAVSEARLTAFEAELEARIAALRATVAETPAEARRGDHCGHCDVRAFCEDHWKTPAALGEGRWVDVEVEAPAEVGDHGFTVVIEGRATPVVWSEEHGPFVAGTRLRVLGARVEGGAVQIVRSSEVFVG